MDRMLLAPRSAAFLVFGLAMVVGPGCFTGGEGAYCVDGSVFLRDPSSGACLLLRRECTPSGPVRTDTGEPLPAWAACEPDACEGVTEEVCRARAGCHPAYAQTSTCSADYTIVEELHFVDCWSAGPADPASTRSCDGLEAEACTRRDDCAPIYFATGVGAWWFQGCTSEAAPAPRDARHPRVPPPPIEPRRNPETGECLVIDLPFCTEPPAGFPDWGPCGGLCDAFAIDEAGCLLADGCRAIYAGAPGFAACWQVPPSGPVRGTPCEGLAAHECSRHDDCAAEHELDPSLGVTAFVSCGAEMVAP